MFILLLLFLNIDYRINVREKRISEFKFGYTIKTLEK